MNSTNSDTNELKMVKSKEPKLLSSKTKQFRETAIAQGFSLPKPIMKHVWENPLSPKVYEKFIKCCKLFLIKNPNLVLTSLNYFHDKEWTGCAKNECFSFCSENKIDMDKINDKIWLTGTFRVSTDVLSNHILAAVIPKIFRLDIKILELWNQSISFGEFKFLSFGVKKCYLLWNLIKYDSGKEVELEEIIKCFPGGKIVFMHFSSLSRNTACKSYNKLIEACNTIEQVTLYRIPDEFNVLEFYQQLKGSKNRALIEIYSSTNTNRIDEVIDEILQTKNFDFVPPSIAHQGSSVEMLDKMKEIQRKEASKYR